MVLQKREALILGWYGYDNLGDELLLDVISNQLFEKINTIYYLCNPVARKDIRRKSIIPISVTSRRTLFRLIKRLFLVDLVVLGGGTYLRDIGEVKNLRFKLLLITLALLFRKKIVLWGGGLGPFSFHKNSRLLRFVLRRIDFVYLRDYDSVELYRSITGREAVLVPDPVFLLNRNLIRSNFPEESRTLSIGLSLREWHAFNGEIKGDQFQKLLLEMAFFLEKVLPGDMIRVVFFVFQNSPDDSMSNDRQVFDQLRSLVKRDIDWEVEYLDRNLSRVQEAYQKVNFFIGMRLHSLILALMMDLPTLAISYDPKVKGLFKQLGISGYNVDYESIEGKNLLDKFEVLSNQNYINERDSFLESLRRYDELVMSI